MITAASRFHERAVDEHIDELRFLLQLRHGRMPFSAGDVREWLAFDRRLAAHVDGLLLRLALAWPRLIALARVRPRPDVLCVAGIVALHADDAAPTIEWLGVAAAPGVAAPWADEITRWVLPGRRARALEHLAGPAESTDLRLALAIELSNLLPGTPASWQALIGEVEASAGVLPLTARALSRVCHPEVAPALVAFGGHASQAVRLGVRCALLGLGEAVAPAEPEPPPFAEAAAGLALLVPIRVAMREASADPELHVAALWQQGYRVESALAAASIGTARLLPGLVQMMGDPVAAKTAGRVFALLTGHAPTVAPTAEAADDLPAADSFPHLPQPEATVAARWLEGAGRSLPANEPLLHGGPRDDARCIEALRRGDAFERLLCVEVLAARRSAFVTLDVHAPMYQQLSHAAMSIPASIAPAPGH